MESYDKYFFVYNISMLWPSWVNISYPIGSWVFENIIREGGRSGVVVERLERSLDPVPLFQCGAPLQFLFHFFLVNFAYIS